MLNKLMNGKKGSPTLTFLGSPFTVQSVKKQDNLGDANKLFKWTKYEVESSGKLQNGVEGFYRIQSKITWGK